jgi:hypothetical protein
MFLLASTKAPGGKPGAADAAPEKAVSDIIIANTVTNAVLPNPTLLSILLSPEELPIGKDGRVILCAKDR